SLWQFASVEEIVKGVFANAVAASVSFIIVKMVFDKQLSFSLYIVAFFVITFSTLFIRIFFRIVRMSKGYFEIQLPRKKALIIGAGQAGVLVLNEVKLNSKFNSYIIGFVDDDKRKLGKYIHSVQVIGKTSELDLLIQEYEVEIVYIAIPQANKQKIKDLLNLIEKTGIQIKLFPPFYEVLNGVSSNKIQLRDINIEDLLGRDPIKLEEDGIRDYIDSKVILVTGGGGSIGSELCRQLRHYNPAQIIVVDIYENNAYDLQMEFARMYRNNSISYKPEIIVLIASVRDENRMNEIFKEYHPDVVFHAAAHKHVPLMEVSPKEAIKNNIFGTYNVAKVADKYNVEKFVLISTDKAVNPTNVMGATKRMAERIIMAMDKSSNTDFTAVRFGNVLGSNGSVIPLFKKQIEDGGPVTVTHPKIIRYFMTIEEACQLVIQTGAYAKGGELFVLDMGEQVKIIDLAEKLIRLSGYSPYTDIAIEFTGLRPGEKMYEELLVDYSKTIKTKNNKIFIEPNHNDEDGVALEEIENISNALCNGNNGTAVELLKEYIKTYNKE
ncbi:MAG: polysaccharide biosynthesis protein, partial [Candidatus Izimaplasma sp.]|nr:polysaccharide biosynthesis protein [Candidatus Izimaplasma bacterium]